jgi:methionyl aminopeptidase
MTVAPFLSEGGSQAVAGRHDWTLFAAPRASTVQYEYTDVATDGRAMIVTLPG